MGVSLRETIFEMASAQSPRAYSRTFNPLLKNRSYLRHGMRVGSNGRNSSRSFESVERETIRSVPMENRESKNEKISAPVRNNRNAKALSFHHGRRSRSIRTPRYYCDGLGLRIRPPKHQQWYHVRDTSQSTFVNYRRLGERDCGWQTMRRLQ